SGRPARTRVASWRVSSDRSVADTPPPRPREKPRPPFFSSCTSVTLTGSSFCSRSRLRTWRGVSPSMTPRRSLPEASSAVYSNAPTATGSVLARHAQHFLDGGAAGQDLGTPVVADRGREGAGVALHLVLGRAVVDHGAQVVVHQHQLVDAHAAAVAAGIARALAGPVDGWCRCVRRDVQQPPLVV